LIDAFTVPALSLEQRLSARARLQVGGGPTTTGGG
jgi:hypothetical protein